MKRWIAGLIGGFALAGVIVTLIVFSSSYVAAQANAGGVTGSSGDTITTEPSPAPSGTLTPIGTHGPGSTGAGSSSEDTIGPSYGDSTTDESEPTDGGDIPLPTADNPWPANQAIPAGLNARIGQAQTALITPCMAAQGFTYLAPNPSNTSMWPPDLPENQKAAYATALDGDWTGTYDWTQAGCRGMAVHETGMDNAH